MPNQEEEKRGDEDPDLRRDVASSRRGAKPPGLEKSNIVASRTP